MKLTNRKIVNDSNFLGALMHKQLPVKVSYVHKFNVNDLLNSNCEMTVSELMLIDYMIEE